MAKPAVAVIGDSGTGKSSTFETLDPPRSCILNTENKPLPMSNFNKFGNVMLTEYKKLDATLDALMKPEMAEKYDNVILDSFTSTCEIVYKYCSKVFTGYEIWGQYNEMIAQVIFKLKKLPQQVFIVALPEQKAEQYGETKSYARIKGKELKYGFLEKELAIVLFTKPIYAEEDNEAEDIEEGEMLNVFLESKANKRNSAKAPKGLFPKGMTNDAQAISDAIKKFYEGE